MQTKAYRNDSGVEQMQGRFPEKYAEMNMSYESEGKLSGPDPRFELPFLIKPNIIRSADLS